MGCQPQKANDAGRRCSLWRAIRLGYRYNAVGMNPQRAHLEKILSLHFSDEVVARYRELSEKVQWGALSDAESAELDELLTTNDFLTTLQAKARSALDKL